MHYKNILKTFGMAFMASLALARDDCETLYKIVTYKRDLSICSMNDAGEVTFLEVKNSSFEIDENTLKKIYSFNTITELNYEVFGNKEFGIESITGLYIEKLKNLKKFTLKYYNFIIDGEDKGSLDSKVLKSLNRVKEVSIIGIRLTQDNIDELTKLKNIKRLNIERVDDNVNMNQLCTQTKCYLEDVYYDPTGTIKYKNDCRDIKNTIINEIDYTRRFDCKMNDYGDVLQLTVNNFRLGIPNSTLKKIFKSTITDLTYIIGDMLSHEFDKYIDFCIDNIEYLDKLTLDYDKSGYETRGPYIHTSTIKSETFKPLTKVKEFTLKYFEISQDNIDELSKFENLQIINFFGCKMDELNLNTLCKKTKCYINDKEFVPAVTTIKTTTTTVKPKKTTITTTAKPKKTTSTTTVKPKKTTTTTTTVSKPTTTNYSSLRYYGTNGSKYPLGVSKLGNISKMTLNSKNKYNNWFTTSTKISYLHLSDSTTEKAGKPSGYCLDVNTSSTDARGNYYLKVVKCSQAKHKFRYIKDVNSINTTNIMIYNTDNTTFKDAEGNNLCVYYGSNPTTRTCGNAKNNSSLGWRRTLGDVITI